MSQSRLERNEQPRGRRDDAEQREQRDPPPALGEPRRRQLQEDDHDRVDEEEPADPALGDAGLVLGEGGQDLELRDPGADVEGVGDHQRHEDPVPEDGAVAAGALGAPSRVRRLVDEDGQHDGVGDERERVEQEQRAEALRRDEAAGDAAEADAEVHHDALHRERRRALRARRQAGEQGRLRRPEGPLPIPVIALASEALPGALRRTRRRAKPSVRKPSAAVSIALPPTRSTSAPAIGPAMRLTAGVRREDEPGDAEADPALVVEVDEQERDDEPVPERVHQPAQLEQLHRAAAGAGSGCERKLRTVGQ